MLPPVQSSSCFYRLRLHRVRLKSLIFVRRSRRRRWPGVRSPAVRRRGSSVCSPAQAPSHGRGARMRRASAAGGAGSAGARDVGCSKGVGERRPQGWRLLSGFAPGAPHGLRRTQPQLRSAGCGRARDRTERSWVELGWGWVGSGVARKFGLGSGWAWVRPSSSEGHGVGLRAGALPTCSGRWLYDR
jgi:hypothetical protein